MDVRVYATLRELLKTRVVALPVDEETTVRQVLRRLVAEHPVLTDKLWDVNENLTGYVQVLVNGRSLEYLPGGLDRQIRASDTLSLFPPVGGG